MIPTGLKVHLAATGHSVELYVNSIDYIQGFLRDLYVESVVKKPGVSGCDYAVGITGDNGGVSLYDTQEISNPSLWADKSNFSKTLWDLDFDGLTCELTLLRGNTSSNLPTYMHIYGEAGSL